MCDVTRPLTTDSVKAWKKVVCIPRPHPIIPHTTSTQTCTCYGVGEERQCWPLMLPLVLHCAPSYAHCREVLDEKVFLPNGKNVPVVLIANKTDLLQVISPPCRNCSSRVSTAPICSLVDPASLGAPLQALIIHTFALVVHFTAITLCLRLLFSELILPSPPFVYITANQHALIPTRLCL